MTLAISIVECTGFGIYSAIFLWCGMHNLVRPNPEAFARLMKAGPVLGLSLGTGIFALIAAIFYFIILRPMKQRQKKVQEFREALKVGDRIITTSGIYGSITKLSDRSIQLQVADKVRIEVSRAAVGGYQGEDPVVQDPGSM